jgi:hypothetical protein
VAEGGSAKGICGESVPCLTRHCGGREAGLERESGECGNHMHREDGLAEAELLPGLNRGL